MFCPKYMQSSLTITRKKPAFQSLKGYSSETLSCEEVVRPKRFTEVGEGLDSIKL